MKRFICILLCALLSFALCACGGGSLRADDTTFLVDFENQCEAKVYALHCEYYLGETPAGGFMAGNAGSPPIAKGDTLTKDFVAEDFPDGASLSDFRLELFLADKDGREYPCGSVLSWQAAYGNTYNVTLSGDYTNGFTAELAAS